VADPRYTSALAEQLAPELESRFTAYVRIDTQSQRDRRSCPSTPGQVELGRRLVQELRELGLSDAGLDGSGYVMATLDASDGYEGPGVGWIAHLDTSPDAPGHGVVPLVHRGYDGGVIALPLAGTVLDPASMPELSSKAGHDIITASGDTLLGADDKIGVAAIITAVSHLVRHPELPRPRLRIAFTPDEEIGEGATLFDLDRFGALCAYTVDGSELGELQDETFSALETILTVQGVDVHPGQASGKLVNALRLMARIVAALPADRLSPETTQGRQGFIHPYELSGSSGRAVLRSIIRDFDDEQLEAHAELLRSTAEQVMAAEPRARLELEVRRQYRNMRRYLEPFPEVVQAAEAALRAEAVEPLRTPIRGGTDGSRLSEMGLPTPNIFTGGHEYHSVREWASLQDMAACAATLVRLAEVWTRPELVQRALAWAPVPAGR
jgi:tripeptide aminopeptidase